MLKTLSDSCDRFPVAVKQNRLWRVLSNVESILAIAVVLVDAAIEK